MDYGYSEFTVAAGSVIQVTLDRQANVLLLDPSDYNCFRAGRSFHYRGGWSTRSPYSLTVPHAGYWYVVVDPQGSAVRYSVRVLQ